MNSFHTPHNEISINISANTLKFTIKKLSSVIISTYSLIAFVIFSIVGFDFLFMDKSDPNPILFALIFIIVSLILNILLYKIAFLLAKGKTIDISDRFIITRVVAIWIPFVLLILLSMANNGKNYYEVSLAFFIAGIGIFLLFFMIKNKHLELTISKESDSYNIKAVECIPLINFAPSWLIQQLDVYGKENTTLHLALTPYTRSLRYPYFQLNLSNPNKYQWLTFEEAKLHSKGNNQFALLLVDDIASFPKNAGIVLTQNLAIENIQQILDFITEFTPFSIIKPENIR